MIRSALTDALVAWVDGVTNREPVFDMLAAMGPRPSQPFASMVLTIRPIGRHYTEITEKAGPPEIPDEPLTETACVINNVLVSMNLVNGDPYGDMLLLRASVGLSKWRDTLWAGGLGFSVMSDARDLTEVVKSDYESRVQADWTFLSTSRATVDIHSIEDVEITNAGTPGSVFHPQAP